MTARSLFAVAVLALPGASAPCAEAQSENTSESRERLVAQRKYPEAHAAYKDALKNDPKNPSLLYNAGLMAYLSDKPREAIEPWSVLKGLEPDDWQVRAKLIQAYQAAGEPKKRDEERADLFALRKNTSDEKLKGLKFYCRDQFSVGKSRLMVFEFFEMEGDEPIRVRFDVLAPDGKSVKVRYSLGSYRTTNEIAAESKQLKAGERLYHLDAYTRGGQAHELYEFYVGEPGYDTVKIAVKEILEGKKKPRSGSSANGP